MLRIARYPIAVLIGSLSLHVPAYGDTPDKLWLKPERCIALHQGQVCYQKITVQWQANKTSNVCLVQDGVVTPLNCWSNALAGTFLWEFEGQKSTKLRLIDSDSHHILVEQLLTVAWVYDANSRRESHWRLF